MKSCSTDENGRSIARNNSMALFFFSDRSDDYSAPSNAVQSQNWDVKNPFKYESSDDEGPDPSIDQLTSKNDALSKNKKNDYLSATKETFFYDVNDQLFSGKKMRSISLSLFSVVEQNMV